MEGIRRGAWLEGTAAQHARTAQLNGLGDVRHLLLRFYRAGTGDNLQLLPAYRYPGDINHAVRRMEHAICTLERLLHAHNLVDRIINTQQIYIQAARITDDAENRHVHTVDFVNLKALALQIRPHARLIFFRCPWLEYYDHKYISFLLTPLSAYSSSIHATKKAGPRKENLLEKQNLNCNCRKRNYYFLSLRRRTELYDFPHAKEPVL